MSFFDEDQETSVVPLVVCEHGQYTVCEDTMRWIESIEGPFRVIACAGKYRTGKSFLLNRLAAADPGTGFAVGSSIQACTKGLWVYKKVVTVDGHAAIIVDTEGIDALDADDTHDVRVFTLALLLSSSFLYNSVGALDETALQTLSLMVRVTERVRVGNTDELSHHMPDFIWVLRDFSLRLVNTKDEPITSAEYLNQALAPRSEESSKNSVREAILNAFPTRKLWLMPRPSSNDGHLEHIEDRPFNQSAKFTKSVEALRAHIFASARPMQCKLTGEMTGKMYAALCKHYARIVQSDAVPVMSDAWSLLAKVQARDIADELLRSAEESSRQFQKRPRASLEHECARLAESVLATFRSRVLDASSTEETFVHSLNALLDGVIERLSVNVHSLVNEQLLKDDARMKEDPLDWKCVLSDSETELLASVTNETDRHMIRQVYLPEVLKMIKDVWIPRTLQCVENEHSTRLHETSLRVTQLEAEQDVILQRSRDLQMSHEELLLSLTSKEAEVEVATHAALQAQQDQITAGSRIKQLEMTLEQQQRGHAEQETRQPLLAAHIGSSPEDTTAEDTTAEAELALQQAESRTLYEMAAHAETREILAGMAERQVQSEKLHQQLEAGWTSGLETLRAEFATREAAISASYAEKEGGFDAQIATLEAESMQYQSKVENYKERELAQQTLLKQKTQENEQQIARLREANEEQRASIEQSQTRVLDMHRSMLDELRQRDGRNRDQQTLFMREHAELREKMSSTERDLEQTRGAVGELKRKNEDLSAHLVDYKRLKTTQQVAGLALARLESENEHMKKTQESIRTERDKIRTHNMSMESDIAVLRAEKQLSDARNLVLGNISKESRLPPRP